LTGSQRQSPNDWFGREAFFDFGKTGLDDGKRGAESWQKVWLLNISSGVFDWWNSE